MCPGGRKSSSAHTVRCSCGRKGIADDPQHGTALRTARGGRGRLTRQVRKGEGSFEPVPRDFIPCRLAKAVREAFGKAGSAHSGALGHREDVRSALVTVLQPRRDARITASRDIPAERRVDLVRFQNRHPRLPPDLPVERCDQRSPVVENEYRVIGAEIAPRDLLLQERHQLPAGENTPCGVRALRIRLAALLSLRVDQQPTAAVIREFHVSDAQRQGFLGLQRRESDGRQEGPQYGAVL